MTAATTTTAATAAAFAARRLVVIVAGTGLGGCDDFGQQRLVLELVEVAGLRIAAGGLPARDHGAGLLIEGAGDLGVKAKPGQPALHVAALALFEPDLVFRNLVGFRGKGRGINAGGQVAGLSRGAVPERGNA